MTNNQQQCDYQTAKVKILNSSRQSFEGLSDPHGQIRLLASWIRNDLKTLPEALSDVARNFSQSLYSSENQTQQYDSSGAILEPPLAEACNALSGKSQSDKEISPLLAYCLGRAIMLCALQHPEGTQGLTLPFRLMDEFDHFRLGWSGADDQLMEIDLLQRPEVMNEITKEVARLADNPTLATFDKAPKPAVDSWKDALGPEESVHWVFDTLLLELPIRDVLLSLADKNSAAVAKFLDNLKHPALQVSVLVNQEKAGIDTISRLLVYAQPVFDHQGQWTTGTGARVLINAFEHRCLEYIEDLRRVHFQLQHSNPFEPQEDTPFDPSPAISEFNQYLETLASSLSQRQDGQRLTITWVCHLMSSIVSRETSARTKFEDLQILLNCVVSRFAIESWTRAEAVWRLLGGLPSAIPPDSSGLTSDNTLPIWVNLTGKTDSVIPCAVAAIFSSARNTTEVELEQLMPWIIEMFKRLKAQPTLSLLSTHPSQSLLTALSTPISKHNQPSEPLKQLWAEAQLDRLKSRFYRPADDLHTIERCLAIAELALAVLIQSTPDKTLDTITLLEDIVNEIRFLIPPIGSRNWSTLAAQMAKALAYLKAINETEACVEFFRPFAGDDDSLANAICTAEKNGVAQETLTKALSLLNIDTDKLSEQLKVWYGTKKGSSDLQATLDTLKRIGEHREVP